MKKTKMPIDEKRLTARPTVADGLLMLFCALVGIFVFVFLLFGKGDGALVRVSIGGEEVFRASLLESGEYSFLDGKIVLKIEGGEAFVIESDCPDKSCIAARRISRGGESIICLPNRFSVTVIGEKGGVDIPIS